MASEYPVFDGKNMSELLKDIYDKSTKKSKDIDELLRSIDDKIKGANDALMFAPVMQSLLETSIRNDDQLVKIAQIVQRIMASEMRSTASGDPSQLLSEEEKDQLLTLMHTETSVVEETIEDIKQKLP